MSIKITLEQAKKLVEAFGGDEKTKLTLIEGDKSFYLDEGLFACNEYPEHGFIFLGKE